MKTTIETPIKLVEELANLRFTARMNRRLQKLMDRNSDGMLTAAERDELATMVDLSETMSLFKAQALRILGRKPKRR